MASGKTYRVSAVVLDKVKLKECDLILTLLASDGRQLQAVAKGARKPGGRLAARCELFCTVDLLLARGRSLDIVSQAELLEAPLGAGPDYARLMAASAAAEVAKRCSFEDAEDRYIFPITQRALELLGSPQLDEVHLDLLLAAYVFKLLSHIGYRPDFSACVSCGDPALSYFSPLAGGLLCASCAASVPAAEPVDAAAVNWLRSLIALRFDELAKVDIDTSTASMLLSFAHLWAATHLDCRLRALEFALGR